MITKEGNGCDPSQETNVLYDFRFSPLTRMANPRVSASALKLKSEVKAN